MKCARESCSRKGRRRQQGLCNQHYRLAVRGYVDGEPVRVHLQRLHASGHSWARIAELTELTEQGVYLIRDNAYGRVQKLAAQRILAIPVPDRFGGEGFVETIGTVRRLQALVAIGWSFADLAKMLGTHRNVLLAILQRDRIRAVRAREIAELFAQLHLIPGPSTRARRHAIDNGWFVPFAWDEDTIDDPDATADLGGKSTWMQQYEDHRWVHGEDRSAIAAAMNIDPASLKRQLGRKGKAA